MIEILEQNRKWQCHFQSPAFSTWDVKRQQQQQQSPPSLTYDEIKNSNGED